MSEDDRGRGQTGAQRYQRRQKMIAIGNDYWIENEQGETVYKVDGKALRWRKTFIFEDAHGNILDHEYTIDAGDDKVAEVSKKWLQVRDSYSVSIEPGQEDFIILAVVLCIDEMTHAGA